MTDPFKNILLGLKIIIENQSLAEGHLKIKDIASNELEVAIKGNKWNEIDHFSYSLAKPFLEEMTKENAISVCSDILKVPFAWVPPKTSDDPLYTAHSHSKVHVELLGPQGIIKSKFVRLGLYGMLPDSEYGIRTHPAEELFIMLAGQAAWLRGSGEYEVKKAGDYSYHPSGMRHATKTTHSAFMSVYIWSGDISIDKYQYLGLPTQ
tara:strand:- start:590 stop:1210 length:621 start_codon:yes stop_codon:yes gene_type:complete